jgi:hypothetical protein
MRRKRDAVAARMDRKVDLAKMGVPGSYLDLHEKLTLELATEYSREEDPHRVSVSWPNQVRAQAYFNERGFEETLDHMLALRARNDARGA